MNPKELRLGNLIAATMPEVMGGGVKIVTVTDLSEDRIMFTSPSQTGGTVYFKEGEFKGLHYINLDERWLLELGFRKTKFGFYKDLKNVHGDFVFTFRIDFIEGDFLYSMPALPAISVQYVHQLQNLFYESTREELIKEEKSKRFKVIINE